MSGSEMSLPQRITRNEVCDLARFRHGKLAAEIKAGRMPIPISRGRQSIFDRDAVLQALGLLPAEVAAAEDVWDVNPEAIRRARAAQRRPRVKA